MITKVIHRLRKVFFWITDARFFCKYSFSSTILNDLKIQGHKFISIGHRVYIHKYVWLGAYKIEGSNPLLEIGDGSCIGNFNHIVCVKGIRIGKNVLTADKVFISDNVHDYRNPLIPIKDQGIIFKKEVFIGDGAWIGENVCIIGANVGKNSIIGANSVVTKDIPDYCIAFGSPAKISKAYNFDSNAWESVT